MWYAICIKPLGKTKEGEIMDLIKARDILRTTIDNFNDDLDFKITIEDGHVSAIAHLTIVGHDDSVLVSFQIFEDGPALIDFMFDNIDCDEETLQPVETFNENVLFLKAEMGDGILTVSCNSPYVTEDSLGDYILGVLHDVACDDTATYLKPLTKLTYRT